MVLAQSRAFKLQAAVVGAADDGATFASLVLATSLEVGELRARLSAGLSNTWGPDAAAAWPPSAPSKGPPWGASAGVGAGMSAGPFGAYRLDVVVTRSGRVVPVFWFQAGF